MKKEENRGPAPLDGIPPSVVADIFKGPKLLHSEETPRFDLLSRGFRASNWITVAGGRPFRIKVRSLNDWVGRFVPQRSLKEFIQSSWKAELVRRAARRSGAAVPPLPIGVFVILSEQSEGEERCLPVPHLPPGSRVFAVYEFENGGGENCAKVLADPSRENFAALADCVRKAAAGLAEIQRLPLGFKSRKNRRDAYRFSLTVIMEKLALHLPLGENWAGLGTREGGALLALAYERIGEWSGREDRLAFIHGDFWPPNVFLRKDGGGVFMIDWSRVPGGDKAFDAAWWVMEHVWAYFRTENALHLELGREFLRALDALTRDKELIRAMCPGIALKCAVKFDPRFRRGFLRLRRGETAFREHVFEILRRGEFFWP